MAKKREDWFTPFGVIKATYAAEFAAVEAAFVKALSSLEGRVSYRDLYEIAHQAGAGAVSRMVCSHVNKQNEK